MSVLCLCYVCAMSLLCLCYVCVMSVLCLCYVCVMSVLFLNQHNSQIQIKFYVPKNQHKYQFKIAIQDFLFSFSLLRIYKRSNTTQILHSLE